MCSPSSKSIEPNRLFRASVQTLWGLALALTAPAAQAEAPACSPCAGIRTFEPASLLPRLLEEPRIDEDSTFFVAWTLELAETASGAPAKEIAPRRR